MWTLEEETGIKELSTWNLPHAVSKPDGYNTTQIPEATSENMKIYMDKINDLTYAVNRLTKLNKNLLQALKQCCR